MISIFEKGQSQLFIFNLHYKGLIWLDSAKDKSLAKEVIKRPFDNSIEGLFLRGNDDRANLNYHPPYPERD